MRDVKRSSAGCKRARANREDALFVTSPPDTGARSLAMVGGSRARGGDPNTPALTLAAGAGCTQRPGKSTHRDQAEAILGAAGMTLWVEDENLIDGITAISGSGPAYVFYFIEALQQAASELGFNAAAARTLALATFEGAIKLARESDDAIATLRAP